MIDTQEQEPVVLPADKPKPRKGERAAQIRQLKARYPELTQAAIAKKVGCHPDNVYQVLRRFSGRDDVTEFDDFRANKTDAFEAVQYRALSSLTDEHYANASLQQIVTSAAIIQDKLQLMNGLPTSIHVTALLDIADLLRKSEG